MKSLPFLASAVLALVSTSPMAQFVKGNEAIRTNGTTKQVDLPPIEIAGSASKVKPCPSNGGCHPGPWYMVETAEGLRECTEPFARPTTCGPSSYGQKKTSRLWVIKSKGEWQLCQYPDLGSECVMMFARPPANLPYPAFQ